MHVCIQVGQGGEGLHKAVDVRVCFGEWNVREERGDIPLMPGLISTLGTEYIHIRIHTHTDTHIRTGRVTDRRKKVGRGPCFHSKLKWKGRGNVFIPFDHNTYIVRNERKTFEHT